MTNNQKKINTNHNHHDRVVITGIGVISPVGHTMEATWQAVLSGKSGIGPITQFDTLDIPYKIAAEVKDFDPKKYMDFKDARRMSRGSQLVVAATKMAIADAGLPEPLPNGERVGSVVGTGGGGLDVLDRELQLLRSKGYKSTSPFSLVGVMSNMAVYHVSIVAGAKGPINTIVTACASGTQSLGEGLDMIRRGKADMVIAGGVEGLVHETTVASFGRAQALSSTNCRPFDANRDGTVIGEGSGMLVLERLDMALERGAKIYGEFLGHASSGDAFHLAQPDPDAGGATRAMRWALEDADVDPESVDYINAHGTATVLNDATETRAIKNVFGQRAYQLPISSTKAVMGHTLGAAGAIEAAICLYAMRDNLIPPTWNYETPDPECDLDYVPNQPRYAELYTILSNSFGMGGANASLVLQKYPS